MVSENEFEIVALRTKGVGVGDIAKKFGINRQSVYDILHRDALIYVSTIFNKKINISRRYVCREKRKSAYDATKAWVTRNIIKHKAHKRVYTAKRNGSLKEDSCEECGNKAQAHHEDYSRPLCVRWLCRKHHLEAHKMFSTGD